MPTRARTRSAGTSTRVLADLHRVAHAMACDRGRETVVRTGRPRKPGGGNPASGVGPQGGEPPGPSLGRKADRIGLTGEVRRFPRLNRRPYGRGHGAQEHGDSGGDGRGVSWRVDSPIAPGSGNVILA